MIDSLSLAMVMPELVLTAGGLLLLMIAAYAGDRATQAVNWLAVLTLAAAGLLLRPCGQQARQGQAAQGEAAHAE